MGVCHIEHGANVVGTITGNVGAVLLESELRVAAHRFRGETGEHIHIGAADISWEREFESLRFVVAEVLTEQQSSGFARIHQFLLVENAFGVGAGGWAGSHIRGFSHGDVGVFGIVGHEIVARCGVGVLHWCEIHLAVNILPCSWTLRIEYDFAAGSHHGDLWQVVGQVFSEFLGNGRATESEDVEFADVGKSPFLCVGTCDGVHTAFSYLDFHPFASGQLRTVGIMSC